MSSLIHHGLILLLMLPSFSSTRVDRSSAADFERLCTYLGAESGVWLAPNPNLNAAQEGAPVAYDLTFICDDVKRLLRMEIGSRYDEGPRRVGWRAVWFWHPGREEIVYMNFARGNVIEGVTEFTAANVFVTTYVRYRPDGTVSRARDENTILSPSEHRTQPYDFEDGAWRPGTGNSWKLQPAGATP